MKNYLLAIFLAILAYLFFLSPNITTVAAGVAIFMIGMHFLEEGFKQFSGGTLETILRKSTDKLYKAILSGFLSTAIVQSSSLISVIAISFLSVGLIELANAIGIVFGANIGTTATSWLVAYFGIKIKISAYAMPIIVFGLVLRFNKKRTLVGLGNILLGLGFIFLGISYMKEGFETLKASIDLAQFAMSGYAGIFVYILVGAVATVVIQSSSATMAIVITALSTQQISYENALALAIGANIGTTVTAVIASLSSNENGRRLAIAHFIFNFVTAFIATAFIYQLSDLVNYISDFTGVASDNYVIKLAIFHTIFNIVGVLVLSPFVGIMVRQLEKLFVRESGTVKAKFLDKNSVSIPEASQKMVAKEVNHLYEELVRFICNSFNLKSKNLQEFDGKMLEFIKNESFDFDREYDIKVKNLSAEILDFILEAQNHTPQNESEMFDKYRLSIEYLLSIVKDIKHLRKNLNHSIDKESGLKKEYVRILKNLFNMLKVVDNLKQEPESSTNLSKLELAKIDFDKINEFSNRKIDEIIREQKINNMDTISLINDGNYYRSITKHLLITAFLLWVNDDLKSLKLSDEILDMLNSTNRYRRLNDGKAN